MIGGCLRLGARREVKGKWGIIADEYRVSFTNDENVLKLVAVMVVQISDYTRYFFIVHFK